MISQIQQFCTQQIEAHLTINVQRLLTNHWQPLFPRLIARYHQHQITFDQLLARLHPIIVTAAPSQQAAFAHIVARCWAIMREGDRQIAAITDQAYLITHARHVGNSLYSLAKDAALAPLNLQANNPKRAGNLDYQLALYAQFQTTQHVLEAKHLPLYDADWLAARERLNQPYWQPEDRNVYDRLGLLPDVSS